MYVCIQNSILATIQYLKTNALTALRVSLLEMIINF